MGNQRLPAAALLSRTKSGNTELNQPTDALTLAQRKLLLMIQRGTRYQTLMDSGPSDQRENGDDDLATMLSLGLVAAVDDAGNSLSPSTARVVDAVAIPSAQDVAGSPGAAAIRAATGGTVGDGQSVHDLRDHNETLATIAARRRRSAALIAVTASVLIVIGSGAWWMWSDESDERYGAQPQVEGSRDGAVDKTAAMRPLYPDEPVKPGAVPATTAQSANVQEPSSGNSARPATPSMPSLSAAPSTMPAESAAPLAVSKSSARQARDSNAESPKAAADAGTPPPVTSSTARPGDSAAQPKPSATPDATAPPLSAKASVPASAPASAPVSAPESAGSDESRATSSALSTAAIMPSSSGVARQPAAAPKAVVRVNPEFPPEAARAGITSGSVLARMRVDADGNVTAVDIVESNPARIFDRAVTRALLQWKFEATGSPRTVDHELEFR